MAKTFAYIFYVIGNQSLFLLRDSIYLLQLQAHFYCEGPVVSVFCDKKLIIRQSTLKTGYNNCLPVWGAALSQKVSTSIHKKFFRRLAAVIQCIFVLSGIENYASANCDSLLQLLSNGFTPSDRLAADARALALKYPEPIGENLVFKGLGRPKRDVYNITAPFKIKFKGVEIEVIAGRVEHRKSENSTVMFFTRDNKAGKNTWTLLKNSPTFELQDPFVTKIGNEMVFGGVKLVKKDDKIISYFTAFYRGNSLEEFEKISKENAAIHGPVGMKDIRMVQLPEGKIGVFTRPQGDPKDGRKGGRGKIGFFIANSWDDLNVEKINQAPLLESFDRSFGSEVWGGVNAAYPLKNGLIGVLTHVAYWTNESDKLLGRRNYYSAVFLFDPITQRTSEMRTIATRGMLPPGNSKRPDLVNVLFSGGLHEGKLYGGAGDAEGIILPLGNTVEDFFAGLKINPPFEEESGIRAKVSPVFTNWLALQPSAVKSRLASMGIDPAPFGAGSYALPSDVEKLFERRYGKQQLVNLNRCLEGH